MLNSSPTTLMNATASTDETPESATLAAGVRRPAQIFLEQLLDTILT